MVLRVYMPRDLLFVIERLVFDVTLGSQEEDVEVPRGSDAMEHLLRIEVPGTDPAASPRAFDEFASTGDASDLTRTRPNLLRITGDLNDSLKGKRGRS